MTPKNSISHVLAITSMLALSAPFACTGGEGEGGGGGGGASSGVTTSKQLKDLSVDEQMDVCTWGIAIQGGENIVTDCGEGNTTESGTVAECLDDLGSAYDACDITVGQLETCVRAIANDPCGAFGTPACSPLLACAGF